MSADEGSRPTLLIVDDEAHILSALTRVLRREPFDIVTATTPEDGLRKLSESQRIDAVLSDHRMPGMTGLQLLTRAAELQPGATRMLITGASEAIPDAELKSAGVRALVTKPWDDARLKQTLRRALGLLDSEGDVPGR